MQKDYQDVLRPELGELEQEHEAKCDGDTGGDHVEMSHRGPCASRLQAEGLTSGLQNRHFENALMFTLEIPSSRSQYFKWK